MNDEREERKKEKIWCSRAGGGVLPHIHPNRKLSSLFACSGMTLTPELLSTVIKSNKNAKAKQA